jgi:exopolysaccharide biosynthesis polyprenyl glycosylphosphotransferase
MSSRDRAAPLEHPVSEANPPGAAGHRIPATVSEQARRETLVNAAQGRRGYVLRRALAVADALGITSALFLAFLTTSVRDEVADAFLVLPTLPLWVVLFRAYGLYEEDVRKVNHAILDAIPRLFHALIVGGLLLWLVYRVIPIEPLSASEVLAFGLLGVLLVSIFRLVARRLTEKVLGPERVLFLGDAPVIDALVRKIRTHPEYSLSPVGIVTDSGTPRANESLPVLADLENLDLPALIEREQIERVIVSPSEGEELMLDLLHQCRRLALNVSLLPGHVEAMGPSVIIDDVEGVTLLELNPPFLPRSSRALKRSMDLFGASVLLLLAAPLMAAIAVAIKLDDGGPILFRQQRVGRGGGRFRLLKFRTMAPDAEARVGELQGRSQDPHWLKVEHDPRVTGVGRFLRLTSLDELPQLFNVLAGEMSLVGPRPLIDSEDHQITGWERSRLDLAPGITGPWQVMGRTNIPFAEMTKLDYLYVTNWSLWMDIKLMLRTLPILLSRRGAN